MHPFISILIAARNEQNNIIDCLKAIEHLTYPNEKFEVLIGNDHSEDDTKSVVEEFINQKPNHYLLDIKDNLGKAIGKANVLAHLARKAKGEYFLFTDADIQVAQNWIQGMLKGARLHECIDAKIHGQTCNHATMQPCNPASTQSSKCIGIVTGVTIIYGKNLFHHLQAIDWLFALGIIKVISDMKIPVTAQGNNMLICREAYIEVGGYENLPSSITEDFMIFREITKKGWQFTNLFNTSVLARSKPVSSIIELLHQRKRWMKGAIQLPFYFVFLLFVQALFYPVIVAALLTLLRCQVFPSDIVLIFAITITIFKIFLQWLFIIFLLKKINSLYLMKYLLIYEVYSAILSVTLIIFYFLPIKIKWKGRKY